MPRHRRCSGRALVALLQPWGFAVVRDRESHMKLSRQALSFRQILIVPYHRY